MKFGKFAILMGVLIVPFFVADVEDVPDMDEISIKWKESRDNTEIEFDKSLLSVTSDKTSNAYEKRIMGIFQNIYDMGFI